MDFFYGMITGNKEAAVFCEKVYLSVSEGKFSICRPLRTPKMQGREGGFGGKDSVGQYFGRRADSFDPAGFPAYILESKASV